MRERVLAQSVADWFADKKYEEALAERPFDKTIEWPRERCIAIRKAAGLTQRQLAELIHLGHSTIRAYENGATIPWHPQTGGRYLELIAKLDAEKQP